jgi:hypothetical protein
MEILTYGQPVKGIYEKYSIKWIRPYMLYGLVLLTACGMHACSSQNKEITLVWKDKRATGIFIPRLLTAPLKASTAKNELAVRRVGGGLVSILGEYTDGREGILFTPLIPFTHGLQYEVFILNKRIGSFTIPPADPHDAPVLLRIYPSSDTLPENLLKIYLRFSQPMRDGQSNTFLTLLKNGTDTVKGAFLDLKPELWDEDRTLLTLWLDPGRIKRDLHPNKLLGAPISKNTKYQIRVSSAWTGLQGLQLPETYYKNFISTTRDSLSPVPQSWKITQPRTGTQEALLVDFGEHLDYGLLTETFAVRNKNSVLAGKWTTGDQERSMRFLPDQKWTPGEYTVRIETRLEDLAGNNINRPFDKNISTKTLADSEATYTEIPFVVKK